MSWVSDCGFRVIRPLAGYLATLCLNSLTSGTHPRSGKGEPEIPQPPRVAWDVLSVTFAVTAQVLPLFSSCKILIK